MTKLLTHRVVREGPDRFIVEFTYSLRAWTVIGYVTITHDGAMIPHPRIGASGLVMSWFLNTWWRDNNDPH